MARARGNPAGAWRRYVREAAQRRGDDDARRNRGAHRGERARDTASNAGSLGAARAIDSPAMERRPARSPVFYAGEPGAFAEDAVLAAFGDVDRRAVGSFRAVFESLAAGPADSAGVIP